ncbi:MULTISPECIES: transglutaminase-like cysteine peptidase [Undibacterium]|nr:MULTISPECIES: transglutaminase-like cysteine peptidase [Undibacterium]
MNRTFTFRMSFLALLLLAFLSLPHSVYSALNNDKLRSSMRQQGGSEQTFNEWLNLMASLGDQSVEVKLQRVNSFFNKKLSYFEDIEIWGQSDYWATPLESMAKGKADCEDFVIAKYFSLRSLNIPDSQLRLVYVKAKIGGPNSSIQQAHMVLAYYPNVDGEPVILDNLITDIRPAARRGDLSPVFSFNSQGVFAGVAGNAQMGPGGTSRLSRWQDLLDRAHKEGFD